MQIVPETIDNTNPNTVDGQTDPFNYPIPGESLTREAGEGNFERPPEQTDPQAVIDDIKNFLQAPQVADELVAQMGAGFPVEAIVGMLTKGGVAQGKFSPDVAEIVKPAITIILISMALEQGMTDLVVFTDQPVDQMEEEAGIEERMMGTMEQLRPDVASEMRAMGAEDRIAQMADERKSRIAAKQKIRNMDRQSEVPSDGSFLEMEEG